MREAAKTRGEPWSLDRIAMVRGWNEAGVGRNEIARRLGISPSTVKTKCSERGLILEAARLNSVAHADDVLLRHYPTMMPVADVLALYREARGDNPSIDAMQKHAGRLKIYRPESYRGGNARRASEVRNLGWTKRRAMLAPQVQDLLNQRVSMREACRRLQVSEKLLQRLKAEALITPLPPLPRVPKMKPAKVAKPAKPPKPKKLPRSWATPRAEPVQRVKAQTVEEFLANGGRIHVCPVVASAPTTATIPAEAREIVREYHDLRRDADTGNWKQRKNAALKIREAWMVKRVVVV